MLLLMASHCCRFTLGKVKGNPLNAQTYPVLTFTFTCMQTKKLCLCFFTSLSNLVGDY